MCPPIRPRRGETERPGQEQIWYDTGPVSGLSTSRAQKESPIELDALLKPRSVAVLGASERPSVGRTIVENLERIGFDGEIYPINPRYETLLGRPCYRSVEDLPDGVDVLAFCVNHERVLDGLRPAARKGIRAAVAFDAGFAESDETGRRRQDELVAICREAGIAFCWPNCMGVISPHERSIVYLNALRDPAPLAGNVGLISQSGSIVIGLLADCRRFGWSRVVSTGNEAVIVAADVLEYLVDDPATHVIAMFLESVRQPDRFVAALDRAADRGKPVIVLKVGRSERARRAITSHTGGLAGESRVIEARPRVSSAPSPATATRSTRGAMATSRPTYRTRSEPSERTRGSTRLSGARIAPTAPRWA